jgi:hypothetical protein
MVSATNIPNLISTFIDLIRDTHAITSITHTGTTYTVNTTDTKRLVAGDYVKINSIEYKIVTLTTNTKFTITSTSAVTGSTWIASAPYFYYGLPTMISNTLAKIKDNQNKYPVIVLFETMPASVDDSPENVEREVSLKLYFVDEANYEDWRHDEYYSLLLNAMQVYVDDFMEVLKNSSRIGILTNHTEINYSKWNLTTDKGVNVFNANLSGIGVEITLPILKSNCSL